jgi:two-component system cell cycle response regulator DivK
MNAKILIADDDYDNRAILTQALEAAGFQVLQAENGQEAIDTAVREKPTLIFLDLSMPKMNGWEAAKRLRQLPELSATPIFAFTAHALQGDEMKAKAAGCDDYISKPCVPREVVQKVRDRLGKKEVA